MGTSWFVVPAEDLVAILMSQVMWPSPVPPPLFVDFVDALYDGLARRGSGPAPGGPAGPAGPGTVGPVRRAAGGIA